MEKLKSPKELIATVAALGYSHADIASSIGEPRSKITFLNSSEGVKCDYRLYERLKDFVIQKVAEAEKAINKFNKSVRNEVAND